MIINIHKQVAPHYIVSPSILLYLKASQLPIPWGEILLNEGKQNLDSYMQCLASIPEPATEKMWSDGMLSIPD